MTSEPSATAFEYVADSRNGWRLTACAPLMSIVTCAE
jgi:hypothetical protein